MIEFSLLQFEVFAPFDSRMRHGISTRHGGSSEEPYDSLNLAFNVGDEEQKVQENYEVFCDFTGFKKEKIIYANQTHTDKAEIVRAGERDFAHPFQETDALITRDAGVPISVRFADCQGVLIYDPVMNVAAAIHSGWRGNAQNIIGKTVQKMVKECGSDTKNLRVGISPSLGPCCAEFTEPLEELPEEMHQYVDGKKVDLWACAEDQLRAEGVLDEHVENMRICTACNTEMFFSYRASGGTTGRMVGCIELLA